MGKVERNHTAAGKYVTADFGYTGRDVYGCEFGAVLECAVLDFRKVLRKSHACETGAAAEHVIACKSHMARQFDALEAGAVLETSMQLIYLVALENDLLQILATIKCRTLNDFYRCRNHDFADVGLPERGVRYFCQC